MDSGIAAWCYLRMAASSLTWCWLTANQSDTRKKPETYAA